MPRPSLALVAACILWATLYGAWPDPAASAAGDTTVSVSGFAFRPQVVRILAGESVTWRVGNDPEQHTVTPRRAGAFRDSGALFSGQAHRVAFPGPGTFAYFCRFHPFMEGSVIVGTVARSTPGSTRPRPARSTPEREPAATAGTPGQTEPGPPRGTPPTATATAPPETTAAPGANVPLPAGLVLAGAALFLAGGAVLLWTRRRRG